MKKKVNKIKNLKYGFTLIEMLVVVLIIGILAGIALPQYQMAVTKAKVASILPLMRRWKDALQEYKLQHGDYCIERGEDSFCEEYPMADTLGVNWPSDWNDGYCNDSAVGCENDYWDCYANEEGIGYVYCRHTLDSENSFLVCMYQLDDEENAAVRGMTTCEALGTEGEKVCKAFGGKFLEDVSENWGISVYKLN